MNLTAIVNVPGSSRGLLDMHSIRRPQRHGLAVDKPDASEGLRFASVCRPEVWDLGRNSCCERGCESVECRPWI